MTTLQDRRHSDYSGQIDAKATLRDTHVDAASASRETERALASTLELRDVDLYTTIVGTAPVPQGKFTPLFNGLDNVVVFDNVNLGSYTESTQYNAGGGNDTVWLPSNALQAQQAGFVVDHLFNGAGGNDVIFGGTAVENSIDGGSGNDILYGGTLKDYLLGGSGDDKIYGGDGDGDLFGGDGNDIIHGGKDYDSMSGGEGNDQLSGGGGNDTINGNQGDDTLHGGGGNDFLQGDKFDNPDSWLGNDNLFGGDGNDELVGDDYIYAMHPVEGEGKDYIEGGIGDDKISGGAGNDTIYGGAGNDQINGDYDVKLGTNFGDDFISGGEGNDDVLGGAGNDELHGDAGNDILKGGLGDDQLSGGTGKDQLWGNDGSDVFAFKSSEGSATLAGADVIEDFKDFVDKLDAGTAFENLSIFDIFGTNDCAIFSNKTNQYVCVIKNTAAAQITEADFVV